MKKNFSVFASAFFVIIFAFVISVISYADNSKGDVNLDGKISVTDAKWILQYVASSRDFNEEQLDSADINGDGKVTVVDAKWILQIVAQLREPPSKTSVEFVTQPTAEPETETTTHPSEEPSDAPEIDINVLKEKIAQAESIDLTYYTDETAVALTDALEEARKIAVLQKPTNEQLSNAYNKLESAVSSLKSLRQYLGELFATAQSIDIDNCESAMVSQLNFRINFAKRALDNEDALPAQLKTAIKFLTDSIDKIDTYKKQLAQSKQELSEKINEAKAIDTSKKIEGSAYTSESAERFKTALAQAQAVYASSASTRTDVNGAAEELKICIENLKTYKQYLEEVCEAAEILHKDPRPDIGSINDKEDKLIKEKLARAKQELQVAIDKALAVYNDPSADDKKYKAASEELAEAVKAYNKICDELPQDAYIDWK